MLQLSALPRRAARAWRLRPVVRPARRLHWPVAASAPKPTFGNANRLAAAGSDQGGGPGYRTEAEGDSDGSLLRAAQPLVPPGRALPPDAQGWAAKWEEAKGRLLYRSVGWCCAAARRLRRADCTAGRGCLPACPARAPHLSPPLSPAATTTGGRTRGQTCSCLPPSTCSCCCWVPGSRAL